MLFGDKIKKLREQEGLLQRQIANQLEIDTPMYSKFERGERLPKEEQLSQLAVIFNIKEKELRTLWLADKILKTISAEPEIKLDAINIIQNKMNSFETYSFDNMTNSNQYIDLYHLLIQHTESEVIEFKKAESNFDFDDLGEYFSALSNEANLRGLDFAC